MLLFFTRSFALNNFPSNTCNVRKLAFKINEFALYAKGLPIPMDCDSYMLYAIEKT